MDFLNRTEEFAYRVCCRTFLSLWSYVNPQGKAPGKELCDILVVCDPHIIVISVKDVELKNTGDVTVDWRRWERSAIDDSVRQLYGATRWIRSAPSVIRKDGTLGLPLPPAGNRKIHRVAVACGGKGEVPIASGDYGRDYVHVMTDQSFELVLRELDTITDFTQYITAKEALAETDMHIDIVGTEADLVAFYLVQGRSFPAGVNALLITGDMWEDYTAKPEVANKRHADQDSHAWDKLIEVVSEDVLDNDLGLPANLTESEAVLRHMARENRFARRQLGRAMREFLRSEVGARVIQSPSGTPYVFIKASCEGDVSTAQSELKGRCFIVRGMYTATDTVIGIAMLTNVANNAQSIMLCRLYWPEWTAADQQHADEIQAKTGAFKSAVITRRRDDEYPQC